MIKNQYNPEQKPECPYPNDKQAIEEGCDRKEDVSTSWDFHIIGFLIDLEAEDILHREETLSVFNKFSCYECTCGKSTPVFG